MTQPFDISWVRSQFPSLRLEVNGQAAAFLDGPAGTQVPSRVIAAVVRAFESCNANTGGAFLTSRRSDEILEAAHAAMADLFGCDADEVFFGPNMTTMTFALARAIGRTLEPGDEIVVTALDHDANIAPWRTLEERGVTVRQAAVLPGDCTLDVEDLRSKIGPRTRLVAVGWAANAVGTINDVALVGRICREAGAWLFVDAVHYAPHGCMDVKALGCDFLACSPYKFFAPHLGAIFGKRELLQRLRPDKVRPASDELPHRWETGTQNQEGLAGLVAAIDYLEELGRRHMPPGTGPTRRQALEAAYRAIGGWERRLLDQLIPGLLEVPGLRIHGIRDRERFNERVPTIAVTIDGIPSGRLAERLAERGIFTWAGHFYALDLVRALGHDAEGGLLRLGLVHYNTPEEVSRLLGALREISRSKA